MYQFKITRYPAMQSIGRRAGVEARPYGLKIRW